MNETERAYAKLSKNAMAWFEDLQRATRSGAHLREAPDGAEFDRRFAALPTNQRRYLAVLIEALRPHREGGAAAGEDEGRVEGEAGGGTNAVGRRAASRPVLARGSFGHGRTTKRREGSIHVLPPRPHRLVPRPVLSVRIAGRGMAAS